jgi:DNA (cytosine-5)-methyltransferase 1
VTGMILGNAKGYSKLVCERLRSMGYRPQLFLLNAADCGVPQRRERVFFCAVREDVSAAKLDLKPSHVWVSSGEACSDVQELTREEIEDTSPTPCTSHWWKLTKPGDAFDVATKKHTGKPKLFSHKKLDGRIPANGLTANEGTFTHWSECRTMSYREWKRLGSFPDDYHAKTDKIGKYMIGMSVPPKMTEYVARQVCRTWLGVE